MQPQAEVRLSRHQLAILISALMATGIGQSLVFAILAPLGREVELGELQITSIVAISALVFGVASPLWGRLSDRLGRKPIIITGLIGYTLGTVAFTSTFYGGLLGIVSGTSLYLLALFVRCGQASIMSATNPASTAYAADHTTREKRTSTMAKLGTANSMGMILGPAVSGALAVFGLLAPLYFAASL
ncbi:MAG: MFS transporter, partial [Halieaceae bacterium]